jgi:hypothetical protein
LSTFQASAVALASTLRLEIPSLISKPLSFLELSLQFKLKVLLAVSRTLRSDGGFGGFLALAMLIDDDSELAVPDESAESVTAMAPVSRQKFDLFTGVMCLTSVYRDKWQYVMKLPY